MPILRLNAGPEGLVLHGSAGSALSVIRTAAAGTGPVIVLIHGFKYDPAGTGCSPHAGIFNPRPHPHHRNKSPWLRQLGFGTGNPEEGLAIAFAWRARGNLWRAGRSARAAGRHLSDAIRMIHLHVPERPIHVISHSMGSEVIFEALQTLPAGAVQRIIALSGATYASRAAAAMRMAAGRAAELFNITSRENDLFDFMFERLIAPPIRGDCAMGGGIDLPNAVNIQLDCTRTLSALTQFGGQIAPARRRICHWSGYARPGALRFYARVLRRPDDVPLGVVRQVLPDVVAPRWSRMFARPQLIFALPPARKSAS